MTKVTKLIKFRATRKWWTYLSIVYSKARQDKIKLQQIEHDEYQERKLHTYYDISQMKSQKVTNDSKGS